MEGSLTLSKLQNMKTKDLVEFISTFTPRPFGLGFVGIPITFGNGVLAQIMPWEYAQSYCVEFEKLIYLGTFAEFILEQENYRRDIREFLKQVRDFTLSKPENLHLCCDWEQRTEFGTLEFKIEQDRQKRRIRTETAFTFGGRLSCIDFSLRNPLSLNLNERGEVVAGTTKPKRLNISSFQKGESPNLKERLTGAAGENWIEIYRDKKPFAVIETMSHFVLRLRAVRDAGRKMRAAAYRHLCAFKLLEPRLAAFSACEVCFDSWKERASTLEMMTNAAKPRTRRSTGRRLSRVKEGEMMERLRNGATKTQVAEEFGVSVRTVLNVRQRTLPEFWRFKQSRPRPVKVEFNDARAYSPE